MAKTMNFEITQYCTPHLNDLLDSIDSENSWNERSIVNVLSLQIRLKFEADQLLVYIDGIKKLNSRLSTAAAILTAISTTGSFVQFIREVVIFRDGSITPSTLNMIILVISTVLDIVVTCILTYLKQKSFDEKIDVGNSCVQDIRDIINKIDNQLVRSSKKRTEYQTFISDVERLYNLFAKQRARLDLRPLTEADEATVRQKLTTLHLDLNRRNTYEHEGTRSESSTITPYMNANNNRDSMYTADDSD